MSWLAPAAARAAAPAARVPFVLAGVPVGSVARAHLGALRAWPRELAVEDEAVAMVAAVPDEALARINAALREQGLIRAWRDELFAVFHPGTQQVLARMERAASRFWGTRTLGAHANGYVAGRDGRPTHLWIAQRSFSKATDPGLFDNLVGGGVPAGQTPLETLVREGFEEAGLSPAQMQPARPGRVIRLQRDIPEGFQFEDLHAFDLALPAGLVPQNQDGEVHAFTLLPVDAALALAAGTAMTVDAALVTLDFALRHRLLPPDQAASLAQSMAPLFSGHGHSRQIT
jgi:8-oxo-dGTP pyrophosphatase MutT (NUDIX family)